MHFWIALGAYTFFLLCYWFFVWSIYWHVREYTLPQDKSRIIVQVFFATIGILSIIATGLFFTLPIPS